MMRGRPNMWVVQWCHTRWVPLLLWLFLITVDDISGGQLFAATPIGVWYAEGGAAQVEIRRCEATLCGRVVWLRSPLTDTGCALLPMRDEVNKHATSPGHAPFEKGKAHTRETACDPAKKQRLAYGIPGFAEVPDVIVDEVGR